MNKNHLGLLLVATSATIVILGCDLHKKNRQLRNVVHSSKKLVAWSELAQQVMSETWEAHPELISELSEDVTTNIEFYSIMLKENLV